MPYVNDCSKNIGTLEYRNSRFLHMDCPFSFKTFSIEMLPNCGLTHNGIISIKIRRHKSMLLFSCCLTVKVNTSVMALQFAMYSCGMVWCNGLFYFNGKWNSVQPKLKSENCRDTFAQSGAIQNIFSTSSTEHFRMNKKKWTNNSSSSSAEQNKWMRMPFPTYRNDE